MSEWTTRDRPFGWWTSLTHGGLLIAPTRLANHFTADPGRLSDWAAEALRRAVLAALDEARGDLGPLLDVVLEQVLGLGDGDGVDPEGIGWRKGPAVGAEWGRTALTGEVIKPRRVWRGPHDTLLPVFTADGALMGGRGERAPRLGIGRGRRPVARVVGWLRQVGRPVALLTNGRQWRLIHAGDDYDAWCEWDIELWFEEGRPGPQVTALRALLGRSALTPPGPDAPAPLVAAIAASRRGQAELSKDLGERVRQAVELLIGSFGEPLDALDAAGGAAARQSLYIAATRLIMRLVVVLFAEARGDDLLPRANAVYHDSYSLQGLREQLDRLSADRLRHQRGAWPRLMALGRLIHAGSPHPDLPLLAYGGDLFRPGDATSADPVLRALAALEDPHAGPNDAAVQRVLALLTRSRVRLAQGKGAIWVEAPVDFSDLSTEYIGILYEGLLDFELRRAPADDAVVFLALGDQPALPLARLEAMDDGAIKQLLEKAKAATTNALAGGEDDASGGDDEAGGDEAAGGVEAADGGEDSDGGDVDVGADDVAAPDGEGVVVAAMVDVGAADPDVATATHARVARWAARAVVAGGLVRKPRGAQTAARAAEHGRAVERAARELTARVVPPGAWFLVRWGGTRKGAGTFYTRPQLAAPTTVRTLRPLAYEPVEQETDAATGLTTVTVWAPKPPEAILDLKVCDPAMGSGSFLVASLRFLTGALLESLYHHGRLEARADQTVARLADGRPADDPSNELLPVPPDHAEFEDRLRARLKRHVVERCLYGVDIDPLAVELARLALWIETMDRSLPFGFLDHKLQVGNSLVGCWLDQVADYPIQAWQRDGGDSTHDRFVHHFRDHVVDRGKDKGKVVRKGDKWTQAIKDRRESAVRPALVRWVQATRPDAFPFLRADQSVEAVHDAAVQALDAIHGLPVHETDERQRRYRALTADPAVHGLRAALDTWCALWFWPGDQLDLAPTAEDFQSPGAAAQAVVRDLAARHGFFHWELAFPEVFTGTGGGFDAVVGNPPWEIKKPNSKEFFSNVDPLYRTYGKQDALRRQAELFAADGAVEADWLAYNAAIKALSNWIRCRANPWGDPDATAGGGSYTLSRTAAENTLMHRAWRQRRAARHGFADPAHPFRHQGSADINTYKLFLEQAHALLRDGGRLGLIVPSGLYTDKGTTDLRTLFLDHASWEWLFGFENRDKIFDIDSRFKFCPVIVQKGGRTAVIRTAFMRRDLDDWRDAERWAVAYPRDRVTEFSPKSRAILEIRGPRDLAILHKLYANGVLLGDDGPNGWGIQYAREFDMTNDSKLFPPRPKWEADGYRGDEYGHWLKGPWRPWDGPTGVASILTRPEGVVLSQDGRWAMDVGGVEGVALPLYQGVMINNLAPIASAFRSVSGAREKWISVTESGGQPEPKYVIGQSSYAHRCAGTRGLKLAFRSLSNSTNERTIIASPLVDAPCGNSIGILMFDDRSTATQLMASVYMTSLLYDWTMRLRIAGTNINSFFLWETVFPSMDERIGETVIVLAASLVATEARFAPLLSSRIRHAELRQQALYRFAAYSRHERLRLRSALDALVAELYGLDWDDLAYILRECDHPAADATSNAFTRTLDPKGFWRVDKDQDPELRHTVLSLIAFADLKATIAAAGGDREAGIAAFCGQNDGDGWMLPEEVRLADYGLGHDARARVGQAVRGRMGERFLPWQLAMSVEESWEACRRHAELIGRIVPWAGGGYAVVEGGAGLARAAEGVAAYGKGAGGQMPLF